jgi:hypothetical protein
MSDRIFKHNLSVGLIIILTKFGDEVYRREKNKVHVQRDLSLSNTEFGNYQKLRYWGLIAKWKNAEGIHEQGWWLLTHRGALFLRNKISVPKSVFTQDNHIVQRGEIYGETGLIKEVKISDIWHEYAGEKWQQFFPWERTEPERPKQLTMAGIGV